MTDGDVPTMGGLTTEEVEERRSQGLVNNTEIKTGRTYLDIIVKNVFTPYNIILFIIGIALFILNDPISAISATGIITVNILVSTVQEMRAKHRLDKISLLTRPKVTVVRDGQEIQIDYSDIVKDDLIVLRAGEQAMVDGILGENRALEMDESILTGESTTMKKNAGDMIYSGSICVVGEGKYTVTAFGEDSYASKMLSSARKFNTKKTPLQVETGTIITFLTALAFIMLLLAVVKEIILGVDLGNISSLGPTLEIFVLCLDIVPMGLFLLITITYMIAAMRMANTGVLLQQSNSVESISHVDTVCMDKTGTITTNKLIFESAEYLIDENEASKMISVFSTMTGSRNRTMSAMIDHYGQTQGELIDEIQFSSARKYSAVKVKVDDRTYSLYSGAWNVLRDHTESPEKIDEIITTQSSKGLRAIVICTSDDLPFTDGDDFVINPLKPVAVVSIRDEVRPDCRETIDVFLDNDMDLKIISGDDPVTVDALFKIAQIPGERNIISGPELDALPEDQKDDVILKTNIFGRMSPENKEEVIQTLKRNRRYVAMIGDGVNDVKPIKAAQVGVALESGSGAARGVADMILVDDDFSALPKAIVEGKRTVSGIRDILKIYLSRNFTLAIMFIAIFFFVGKLPMLPIQNTFYAFTAVTIIAFFMTVFALPDDNKELILPNVFSFCIPSAITIGLGGLIVYCLAWQFTNGGFFVLDYSYLESQTSFYGKSIEEIVDYYLLWQPATDIEDISVKAEIMARNCMVLYASLIGAIQVLIVCPRFKFLSADGKINTRKLPIILVIIIILLIIFMYVGFPAIATFAAMVIMPAEAYIFVIAMVAISFFIILFSVKKNVMRHLVSRFQEWYLKRLDKEFMKNSGSDPKKE